MLHVTLKIYYPRDDQRLDIKESNLFLLYADHDVSSTIIIIVIIMMSFK